MPRLSRSRVLVGFVLLLATAVLIVLVVRGGPLVLLVGPPMLLAIAGRAMQFVDLPGRERYWDRTHDVQERLSSDSDNATLNDLDRYR